MSSDFVLARRCSKLAQVYQHAKVGSSGTRGSDGGGVKWRADSGGPPVRSAITPGILQHLKPVPRRHAPSLAVTSVTRRHSLSYQIDQIGLFPLACDIVTVVPGSPAIETAFGPVDLAILCHAREQLARIDAVH